MRPIKIGGQYFGVMVFSRPPHARFDKMDLLIAQEILDIGLTALENAILRYENQVHSRLLNRIKPVTQALNRPFKVSEITEAIGQGALALTGADRLAVYGHDGKDQVLHVWSRGLSSLSLGSILAASKEPGASTVADTNRALITSDGKNLPGQPVWDELAGGEQVKPRAVCPVVFGDHKIASIDLYYNDRHEWTQSERDAVSLFASHAAIALENIHLSEELESSYMEA